MHTYTYNVYIHKEHGIYLEKITFIVVVIIISYLLQKTWLLVMCNSAECVADLEFGLVRIEGRLEGKVRL